MQTASKKIVNAWAMYDWANSAYNLVITSTIFPAYYVGITAGSDSTVTFFGRKFVNTALENYTLAAVFFLVALTSPILSSIADYRRNKKIWLRWFCYIGSASCVALYFFGPDENKHVNIEYGMFAFGIAALGYWSSLVFY